VQRIKRYDDVKSGVANTGSKDADMSPFDAARRLFEGPRGRLQDMVGCGFAFVWLVDEGRPHVLLPGGESEHPAACVPPLQACTRSLPTPTTPQPPPAPQIDLVFQDAGLVPLLIEENYLNYIPAVSGADPKLVRWAHVLLRVLLLLVLLLLMMMIDVLLLPCLQTAITAPPDRADRAPPPKPDRKRTRVPSTPP